MIGAAIGALAARLSPALRLAALLALPGLVLYAPQTVGGRSLVPWDALLADPVFRPAIEARGHDVPQNDLLADLVFQNIAWKSFAIEAFDDEELPLWNPLILGGVPFLAAGQHGVLYPTMLIHALLGAERGFGWSLLAGTWLAAMTAYALGRALGLGRSASYAMGAVWSISLPMVSSAVFPMIQGALGWSPLLMAAVIRLTDRGQHGLLPTGRKALWLATAALTTALIALSGHVEMLYYAVLVAIVLGAARAFHLARHEGAKAAGRSIAWCAGSGLAGVLLAGVLLVPLYELAATNHRAGTSFDEVVRYAFGLRQLGTFLVPNLYGSPAHHTVIDLVHGARVALTPHAMWGTAWGTKNYVEAAAYVGILPLALAALALFDHRRRRSVAFLVALAAGALAFAFGTPTYRLVFALPGIEQLHSPFRWVLVLALAVVALAGIGADALIGDDPPAAIRRAAGWLGGALLAASLWLLVALALAFALPSRWTAFVMGLVARDPLALSAVLERFPDGSAFASYQFGNALHAAVFGALSGALIVWLARRSAGMRAGAPAAAALVAVALIDLGLIGFGFNPAVDRALGSIKPPPVAFLEEATAVKWGRVVGFGDERVLWPNTAMRFGIPDVRGYDSIIPGWTAGTLGAAADQTGNLLYNRIGNLTDLDQLGHAAMRGFGARYVVTRQRLDHPDLTQVYDDEVRIYEYARAMPRAWLVNKARVVEDGRELLDALALLDPEREVLLQEEPDLAVWRALQSGRPIFRPFIEVKTDRRNALVLDAYVPEPGLLVLSESWFPGWRAFIAPAGAGRGDAFEVPVYRANGALRAVPVPAGRVTVSLAYFPMSLKAGLYASFIGAILVFLALVYALWTRVVRVDRDDEVQVIAVNSAGPMAAAILNKVLLFAFAMLYLRVIGPAGNGKYSVAVTVYGLAEILSGFGLSILVAREVARSRHLAGRYLVDAIALRVVLAMAVVPLIVGYIAVMAAMGRPLDPDTVTAIGLLTAALIPANLNAALASLFQGLERMVLPAAVSIVSALLTITLGALALLAGYGFVGMAAAAVATNWLAFAILAALTPRDVVRRAGAPSVSRMAAMLSVGLPLMLNQLLQTAFFKVDILLLQPLAGETVVGWYSSAYKWIDALILVPAYLVMALFPLFSRRAAGDMAGLRAAYVGTLRWLLALALPVAVLTTYLAEPLIRLLAGESFLPHGARALQIMVWFLPLSYVNGVTQYVLIALDRQRWITLSFVVAFGFNVVANLFAIPRYDYVGAAVVTILSEVILLAPFLWRLRDLGAPPLLVLAWRPLLGASAMAIVLLLGAGIGLPLWLGTMASAVVYGVILRVLGWWTASDRAILDRLRPARR